MKIYRTFVVEIVVRFMNLEARKEHLVFKDFLQKFSRI